MSKLYIGNLSPDVSQELLLRELGERNIDVQNIVLNKRGFAFIDCNDLVALDKAIEKLSGLKINGKEISVEHSGRHFLILKRYRVFRLIGNFFPRKNVSY